VKSPKIAKIKKY